MSDEAEENAIGLVHVNYGLTINAIMALAKMRQDRYQAEMTQKSKDHEDLNFKLNKRINDANEYIKRLEKQLEGRRYE